MSRAVHREGDEPCGRALKSHHEKRPFDAQLPLDRGDGGHAGGVQKAECQKAESRRRGQRVKERVRRPKEHREGGNDALLGHKSGNQRGGYPPVAKAERDKERRDESGDHDRYGYSLSGEGTDGF